MPAIQRFAALISIFCFSFLLSSFTHAQTEPILVTTDPNAKIQIAANPQNPAPGDTVHLTVTGGSLVDLQDSAITWYLNSKNVSKGVGNTTFDTKAGPLGQSMDIVVQVTQPGGESSSVSLSIIPTHIDLLMDSDSYTPPFYRGRALPSAGTRLHMQALAYFKRPDGSVIPPSSIVYTWKQNGQVVGNVSGRGRQTVILPSPVLYETDTISVDAVSVDGTLRGSASVDLSSVQPILTLYQDHPLFGLMYYRAMGGDTSIPDSEMTFAAVPYFAQIQSPTDPRLRYVWTINAINVPANATRPDEVTINADKSNGKAVIELSVSHTTNFLMNASGAWNVTFRSSTETQNPFSIGF